MNKMSYAHTPFNHLQVPCCRRRLRADDAMFGWVAPWEGVAPKFLKDPYVYKYRCYNMRQRYNPCNNPPRYGYGVRSFAEPRKMVEGFDFAHSVNDYTPYHCKYNANGTMRCFPRTKSRLMLYDI